MSSTEKEMSLRYAGACSSCGVQIPQGTRAIYDPAGRSVRHLVCDSGVVHGSAGASAYREFERRTERDERRVAAQKQRVADVYGTGLLGKVATFLAVDDTPRRSTQVWAQGAVGEERVAESLDRLSEVGVIPLHDRRIPGTRANIDHIAVTPWGVWVIDAKRYLNKRPTFVTEGGLFGFGGTTHLTVGGRRRDELVEKVLWQGSLVQTAVGADIPVRCALAFVDAEWPLIGGDFVIRDVAVLWPKRLAKLLLRNESPTVDVGVLAPQVASAFPPA